MGSMLDMRKGRGRGNKQKGRWKVDSETSTEHMRYANGRLIQLDYNQ